MIAPQLPIQRGEAVTGIDCLTGERVRGTIIGWPDGSGYRIICGEDIWRVYELSVRRA